MSYPSGLVPESVGPIALRDLRGEIQRTNRGLRDPNPGLVRLGTSQPVMSSPPTITVATGTPATSTIAGGVTHTAVDGALRYYGAGVGPMGVITPRDAQYGGLSVTPNILSGYVDGSVVTPPFAVDLEFDGSALEFYLSGNGGTYRVLVDGQYVALSPSSALPSNGWPSYVKVDFGSRSNRRIALESNGLAWINGIVIGPNDTIWRSQAPLGPRLVVIGDSFGEGANGGGSLLAFPRLIGSILGWQDVWASCVGGTGYVNPGPTSPHRVAIPDRIVSDVVSRSPDIVIVTGGINDEGYPAAAVQAAAAATCSAIRQGLPDTKLVVVGPFSPSGSPTSARVQTRDAIRAGSARYAHLFIDPIGGAYPYDGTIGHYVNTGWITGTGRVGSTTGSGNADLYTSSDTTHPTSAGQAYLARRIASAIAMALPL